MGTFSKQQFMQEWVAQAPARFRKYAPMMAELSTRESHRRTGPKVRNDGLNKNGTVDHGPLQVNDIWRSDPVIGPLFKSGAIYTMSGAVTAGIRILEKQGLAAWSTHDPAMDAKYIHNPKLIGNYTGGGKVTPGTSYIKPGKLPQTKTDIDSALIDSVMSGEHGTGLLNGIMHRLDSGAYTSTTAGTAPQLVKGAGPKTTSGSSAPYTKSKSTGKFTITGAHPDRLTDPLVAFARKVAGVYGKPLTGDSGATHSKYTVDGNVSDHWSGNATDIPATGKTLLAMGRAALIAAGMDPKQAMKQNGGLYNINGHQVIFLTNQGGNHYNHLHISV